MTPVRKCPAFDLQRLCPMQSRAERSTVQRIASVCDVITCHPDGCGLDLSQFPLDRLRLCKCASHIPLSLLCAAGSESACEN